MATKTKLEQAITEQVESLSAAEREVILSEFRPYKWNTERIKDYEALMKTGSLSAEEEKSLLTRRHQLVTENTAISTKLLRHLKGTAVEEDEVGDFM